MSKRAREQQRADRIARARVEARRTRIRWVAGAAIALAVVLGVAFYAVGSSDGGGERAVPVAVSDDRVGLVLGSGPVTVELYSDFLCPACRAFDDSARDDIEKLLASNRIRLVYHPVAILDRMSTNEYSTRAAAGAGCASDAGKLMEYHRALFDEQPAEGGPGHENEDLVRLATAAGVTDPAFGTCLRDGRYVPWVGDVTDEMARRGVRGTPTVFVAGKQLPRPTGEGLVSAVDATSTR